MHHFVLILRFWVRFHNKWAQKFVHFFARLCQKTMPWFCPAVPGLSGKEWLPVQLTSLPFFGCFALLFALYWLVGQRARTPVLFAASLLFYTSFGAEYLVLLLASCLFTWAAGLMLAKNSNRFKLAVSVIIALAPLLLVKYFGI